MLFRSARNSQDPQLQTALEIQSKLAIARPHWSWAFTLRGLIESRLGQWEKAAAALEKAVQLGERRLAVFEDLISVLDKLNRPVDAEKYLSRLEINLPSSQRLTELAGGRELRHDNPEQAITIARAAVAQRPKDAAAHLWLGRLLLVTKNNSEAEKEFTRALELAPRDARAWIAMFIFRQRTGNIVQAREVLEQLLSPDSLSSAITKIGGGWSA